MPEKGQTNGKQQEPVTAGGERKYTDAVVGLKSVVLFVVLTILNIAVFVFMVFENQMELIAKNAELASKDKGITLKLRIEGVVGGEETGSARRRYEVVAPMARVFGRQEENSPVQDTLVVGETVFSEYEVAGWHRVLYRGEKVGWVLSGKVAKHVPAWKTGRLSAEDVRLILDILDEQGVDDYTVFMESGYILADSRGREGEQADTAEAELIRRAVFSNSFENMAFYQHVRHDDETVDIYIPVYYSLNKLLVIRPSIPMRYVRVQKAFLYRQCVVVGLLVLLVHIFFVLVNHGLIIVPMVRERTHILEVKNRQIEEARQELQQAYDELSEAHEIITDELETAREIQLAIIPRSYPDVAGYRFHAEYLPAARVSGDYYDFFTIDKDHLGILIADASGHGIPAAFVVSMAKMSFTEHAAGQHSPATMLDRANGELVRAITTSHYLTAFYGVLHLPTGRLTFTRASHPYPLWLRHGRKKPEQLDTEGFFVAMMEEPGYKENSVVLKRGDRVVMFTDGLFEAANPEGKRFERDKVDEYLVESCGLAIEEQGAGLVARVKEFARDVAFEDDVTLLIVERV
jgi:serine phosphatase RsbU (regulator of sigma subunit)